MIKLLKIITVCSLLAATASCENGQDSSVKKPSDDSAFAKGADIGWYTEMESKGYKFYTASEMEKDCPELMKLLGFNSLRFRVWVNPENGWNSGEDLLKKCLRAKELGMRIMIDFHYSDSWADPGQQTVPRAWQSYGPDELVKAVSDHTADVLGMLKQNGIDVSWVQVGNEVTNGMLWESGRVKGQDATFFTRLFNAGAAQVRDVFPNAKVILHVDNAWKKDTLDWFFSLMRTSGVKYDMIGLSLYPSWWDGSLNAFAPWEEKVNQAVANISYLIGKYNKDVMLVEFGMPASEPQKAKAALEALWMGLEKESRFKGIFYWEPESEHSRNGYDLGAFADGRPTVALDPFSRR